MSENGTPDRSERTALYMSIAITGFAAAVTAVTAISRLTEVAPGHDIPVTVPIADESVGLPLGPNGAMVTTQVDTVTVTVNDPAPATLFALWAQPIWMALCIIAGLVLAAMFFARVARGQIFTRNASRIATAGATVVAVGWLGATVLTNMSTNGALAAISDKTYESVIFNVSMVPFLAVLLLGGLAGALQLGERLQRDTEGLV